MRTMAVSRRIKALLRWLLKKKTLLLHCTFTQRLAAHYCTGIGCELGPGLNPQTAPRSTYYLDRFSHYQQTPIQVDLRADGAAIPFADASMDYLFSSHMLEHCPDTIGVLKEWLRVLKPSGVLMLRLPHARRCFDCHRPLTTLQHHIEDHLRGVGLEDQSHCQEFVDKAISSFKHHWVDEARLETGGWDFEYLIAHGHIHYHVWTPTEMIALLLYLKCRILFVIDKTLDREDSFCIVAQAPEAQRTPLTAEPEAGEV